MVRCKDQPVCENLIIAVPKNCCGSHYVVVFRTTRSQCLGRFPATELNCHRQVQDCNVVAPTSLITEPF